MKAKRFYVAPRNLVCDLHRDRNSWSEDDLQIQTIPFTADYIEDMVDLLRIEPRALKYDLSGICCF